MNPPLHQHPGSLMIDILLGVGVAGLFAVALGGLAGTTNRSVTAARHQTEAAAYAKASMEEVVAVKNADWNELRYGPVAVDRIGQAFRLRNVPEGAVEIIDWTYERQVRLDPAYRDQMTNKLAMAGRLDPNVMHVTVTIRWTERSQAHQVTLENYLTNWRRS